MPAMGNIDLQPPIPRETKPREIPYILCIPDQGIQPEYISKVLVGTAEIDPKIQSIQEKARSIPELWCLEFVCNFWHLA